MIRPSVAHGIAGKMQFKIANAKSFEDYQAALNETYYSMEDIQEAINAVMANKDSHVEPDEVEITLDEFLNELRSSQTSYKNEANK